MFYHSFWRCFTARSQLNIVVSRIIHSANSMHCSQILQLRHDATRQLGENVLLTGSWKKNEEKNNTNIEWTNKQLYKLKTLLFWFFLFRLVDADDDSGARNMKMNDNIFGSKDEKYKPDSADLDLQSFRVTDHQSSDVMKSIVSDIGQCRWTRSRLKLHFLSSPRPGHSLCVPIVHHSLIALWVPNAVRQFFPDSSVSTDIRKSFWSTVDEKGRARERKKTCPDKNDKSPRIGELSLLNKSKTDAPTDSNLLISSLKTARESCSTPREHLIVE